MNVLNFKQGTAATMMFSEEEKIKNYFLPFFSNSCMYFINKVHFYNNCIPLNNFFAIIK